MDGKIRRDNLWDPWQTGTSEKLKYKQDTFGITISLPKNMADEADTILVIEI